MPALTGSYNIQTNTGFTSTTTTSAINLGLATRAGIILNVTNATPSAVVVASTAFNTSTGIVTATAHGLQTGLKGQWSTSITLPTGLLAVTDYFIIVIDANSFKLASSLVNALAGTALTISAQGAGNDTFTPTTLAGASYTLQCSNDAVSWGTYNTAVTINGTEIDVIKLTTPEFQWFRLSYTLTAGALTIISTTSAFIS